MCNFPQHGFKSITLTARGKHQFTRNPNKGIIDAPSVTSCGSCLACRIKKASDWAVRCQHEARMHDANCFITLTYSDDNLPKNSSLDHVDFQLFMKRFRKRISDPDDKYYHPAFSKNLPVSERKVIRYYMCGEYGEKFGRPHFHAIIFGYNFPDLKVFEKRKGYSIKRSPFLESLWSFGHSSVGDANHTTAAYVARYVVKKITGIAADAHYKGRTPEYARMSRRGGIARKYIEKYFSEVYSGDFVLAKKFDKTFKKQQPPKYYDNYFEVIDPDHFDQIKDKRLANLQKKRRLNPEEFTPQRLRVKEAVLKAELEIQRRPLK